MTPSKDEFKCPECADNKTFREENNRFLCDGCDGIISMQFGKKIQPIGTVHALKKACDSARIVMN